VTQEPSSARWCCIAVRNNAPTTGPRTVPRPPTKVISTTSPDIVHWTSVSDASWKLQTAESARVAGRPTYDLTAYDLYLRACAMVLSSARHTPEALGLLEQAIERDPRRGPALARAALCCVWLLREDRSKDPQADRLKGTGFARRALEVAGDDPGTLANAAHALAHFGEDIGAMMALVDRALVLNPSFARGWHISGILRIWAGQPDVAIQHVNAALILSPRAPALARRPF
jgi:hypothetical protein